jgi:predicted ATPase
MSYPTLTIQNLRAVRHASLELGPVTVLVGPNGCGKTTLVLALRMLRAAWDRQLDLAIVAHLGTKDLRNWRAKPDEPVRIAIREGTFLWQLDIYPDGTGFNWAEVLKDGEEVVVRRTIDGRTELAGQSPVVSVGSLAVRLADQLGVKSEALRWVAGLLSTFAGFHDPDVVGLGSGSQTDHNTYLDARGGNVANMLRKWSGKPKERWRSRITQEHLAATFPGLVKDFEFEEAGNILAMKFWANSNDSFAMNRAANGLRASLIHAAAVASGEPKGIIAIDEPEYALHPSAINSFMSYARSIAELKDIRLIFTTHSPVVLATMQSDLDGIWVFTGGEAGTLKRVKEVTSLRILETMGVDHRFVHGSLGTNSRA